MTGTKELRQQWRAAKRLRRAKRRLRWALWTGDRGYGMGQKFHGAEYDGMYNRVSEAMGILEAQARILEGRCE